MKACSSGKYQYGNRADAERACNGVKAPGRRKRHRTVHPYKCGYCGQWHLGNGRDKLDRSPKYREARP